MSCRGKNTRHVLTALLRQETFPNSCQRRPSRIPSCARLGCIWGISVKTPRAYSEIDIPDEHGQFVNRQATCKSHQQDGTSEDGGVRRLPIMALQPGVVLAEDLRTEGGALLLQRGTILSELTIQRLRDVADANGLHGNIPVR